MLWIGRRDNAIWIKEEHRGPAVIPGSTEIARISSVVWDPYTDDFVDLSICQVPNPVFEPEVSRMKIQDVLQDAHMHLHPAERYFLKKFCSRGPIRLELARNPQMWRELKGVAGHDFGGRVWVVPLKSPTLPPAKHTNMIVLGEPGLIVDPAAHLLDERKRALALLRRIDAISGPLQAIWLTHHHHDHIGAASWLAEHLNIPIWGHTKLSRLGKVRLNRAFEDGQVIRRRARTLGGRSCTRQVTPRPTFVCGIPPQKGSSQAIWSREWGPSSSIQMMETWRPISIACETSRPMSLLWYFLPTAPLWGVARWSSSSTSSIDSTGKPKL